VPVLTASVTNSNNNNGIASTEFTLGTIYAQNNLVQLKLDGVKSHGLWLMKCSFGLASAATRSSLGHTIHVK
jgi:hypothetical protein